VTTQGSPETPAGQPESDQDRKALLARLLAERFPGMHRGPVRLTPPDEDAWTEAG
jgi:hypothetical protein